MFKLLVLILIQALMITNVIAQTTEKKDATYRYVKDIPYRDVESDELDEYAVERCKLDIYYPEQIKDAPTVVWFHGGGLRSGEKSLPDPLKNQGMIVVAVNYRLFPKVQCPVYTDDAAAAIAWIFNNIDQYGGDTDWIFVSGHSAGGYLTSMVGLDKSYLAKYGVDANDIAGLIPFSGHTITHFTPREERDIPSTQPIVDAFAPLYHVRSDAPPLVLITGDRDLEMLARYEENAYLMRMMKVVGHKSTELYEIQGHNHGDMVNPAFNILIKHINAHVKQKRH